MLKAAHAWKDLKMARWKSGRGHKLKMKLYHVSQITSGRQQILVVTCVRPRVRPPPGRVAEALEKETQVEAESQKRSWGLTSKYSFLHGSGDSSQVL